VPPHTFLLDDPGGDLCLHKMKQNVTYMCKF